MEITKRTRKCPVCGALFTARRVTQKYCSAFCRRYAHRYGFVDHYGTNCEQQAVRQFCCLRCGAVVVVTDERDRRTKFCSSHCERLYWKHSQKVRSCAVQRSFHCRNCGVLVEVRDPKDKRLKFCSQACREQWFSRHRNKKKKTKTVDI